MDKPKAAAWSPIGLIRVREDIIVPGEAPDWVREAWGGLELPCYPTIGTPVGACSHLEHLQVRDYRPVGVISGIPNTDDVRGVVVPQAEALNILAENHSAAARWWRTNGFPKSDPAENCFFFPESVIKIISGVTAQRIREVTDEMNGDPNR